MDAGEELLEAWVSLTVNVRGNRLLRELSLNEMLILGMLYREEGRELSATQITDRVKLLKSQSHKVMSALEERGLIERRRDAKDGRVVNASITEAGRTLYQREHGHVMELVRRVVRSMGDEDAERLTQLLRKAIDAADAAQEDDKW